MATPSNNKLNRTGGEQSGPKTDSAKENYHAIKLSNPDASLTFSQIHKKADVTAAVMLQTLDAEHSFFMDKDGTRKGCTTSCSPRRLNLECGSAMEEAEDSLFINAKNGNIIIKADNGKIRMEATDIELITTGDTADRGNIKLTSSQNVIIEADKKFLVDSKHTKMVSTGQTEISANTCMRIYGSIIRGVTDACSVKDSKNNNQRTQRENNQV